MRPDTRPKPSSFSSEDDDDGKFYVKPNFADSDEPPPSKKKINNKVAPTQVNTKSKRHREEKFQGPSSSSKKKKTSKKGLDKSEIDLEELLARTYPKEISAPVEHAKQNSADGLGRRSSRKKKSSAKQTSDSSKKWSGDEEICLSMAVLECASPEGEVNISAFYQRAKETLQYEVSNSRLYEKMRSMRKRFRAIQSKLKKLNISEDVFPYRTPQEPALLVIWKQIWGNDHDNQEIEFGNSRKIGGEYPRESDYETPRENESENTMENGGENHIEIESESPRVNDAEILGENGAESPRLNDAESENPGETDVGGIGAKNPRGIEGEDCREIGSENPRKNDFTNPRGNGFDEDQHKQERHEEEKEEQQNIQNSPSQETRRAIENRECKLLQSRSEGLEDNIKIMLENTESKLQASIESLFNRVSVSSAAAANFQPLGGFVLEMGLGSFLSKKMEELMNGVKSVKEFPGLDSAEAKELQQKWHTLKIQELRMFCDTLDLLQKQCKLLLMNVETSSSNENHGS